MDLSKYNLEIYAEQGAVMELEDPVTGEVLMQDDGETPVTIKLLGQDSKIWRKKNKEFQNKRISEMAKNRKRKMDYSVKDEEACEMLAACTLGWEGIEEDGEAVEFSIEKAQEIYMKYNWIREQADSFVGDRANFFTS